MTLYRDSFGRFTSKPPVVVASSPSFHNVRDARGRFIPKAKATFKDSLGNYRYANGRFAPKPTIATTAKVKVSPSGPNQRFTLNDLVTALELNGYKQGFGHYVKRSGDKVLSACAMGQAALNIGIDYRRVSRAFSEIYSPYHGSLSAYIIDLNDNRKLSIKKIGAKIREEYGDKLSTVTTLHK